MPSERALFERPVTWLYGLVTALVLVALVITVVWLGPLPPRVVVMTTGTPGSAYDVIARRYQVILRRSGIQLRLLPSAGGVENIRRLQDPQTGVAVGFAQGGLTSEAQSPELESLGTVFYEPFWFFYRGSLSGRMLEGLRGKRLSIGPEGGGARVLALQFMALNGIDQNIAQFVSLNDEEAGAALLRGDIAAAMLVASWDSDVVRRLLASSDVSVLSFARADAYVALYPYLNKLLLPTGVGNLATNRPPEDVNLLAPKASLIVRRDLHPAIQYLLLEAATEIHSPPTIFQKAGEFPAAERVDLPLAKDARQFFKSGTPLLQRYLPFWLAVFASRILVLAIPLIGIAYPLLRFTPAVYGWSMRHRIFRLYGELKVIELELEAGGHADRNDMLTRLERLDARANQLRIPTGFASLQYQLRSHIALVRSRLLSGAS
jgi:TRAP-type uncharacterized transport system substrate-binding protein